jgi:hypothetical protein
LASWLAINLNVICGWVEKDLMINEKKEIGGIGENDCRR